MVLIGSIFFFFFTPDIIIRAVLTWFDVTLLAAEPLGKLVAVPYEQLLVGFHRLDGVKVNVAVVLASHQVLFSQGVSWVDISHPVASVDVITIDKVLKPPSAVNLEGDEEKV